VTCEVVPVAVITSGHRALQYRIRAPAVAEAAARQLRAHGLLCSLATLPGERQAATRRAGHHSPAQFLIHHTASLIISSVRSKLVRPDANACQPDPPGPPAPARSAPVIPAAAGCGAYTGPTTPHLLGECEGGAGRVAAQEPPHGQADQHRPAASRAVGQVAGIAAVHPRRPGITRRARRARQAGPGLDHHASTQAADPLHLQGSEASAQAAIRQRRASSHRTAPRGATSRAATPRPYSTRSRSPCLQRSIPASSARVEITCSRTSSVVRVPGSSYVTSR
jgi:hypothetical protein